MVILRKWAFNWCLYLVSSNSNLNPQAFDKNAQRTFLSWLLSANYVLDFFLLIFLPFQWKWKIASSKMSLMCSLMIFRSVKGWILLTSVAGPWLLLDCHLQLGLIPRLDVVTRGVHSDYMLRVVCPYWFLC